jgi:peptide-methionine (S)-S-oxide reductase
MEWFSGESHAGALDSFPDINAPAETGRVPIAPERDQMLNLRYLWTARTYLAGGLLILVVAAGVKVVSNGKEGRPVRGATPSGSSHAGPSGTLEKATFGAGCFWCAEAMFHRLKGVESVVSGYSGGRVKNPTYEEVCSGSTGHAEVVQVTYDPRQISYADLLEVFWGTHDPTTRNRQGNDVGTQYRSVIFYHSEEQRKLAEHYLQKLDASGAFRAPIVTEISPFGAFFPAENYHQSFYELNARQPYCQIVIRPKVEKLEKVFRDKLKDTAQEPVGRAKR